MCLAHHLQQLDWTLELMHGPLMPRKLAYAHACTAAKPQLTQHICKDKKSQQEKDGSHWQRTADSLSP
jgi:hypothetical protein